MYPPNGVLTYKATPSVPMPGYLSPIKDPTFGTTINRIGDTASAVHTYSRRQAWSFDESMILLGLTSGKRKLLNASDYSVLNASVGGDGIWSETENVLWRINNTTGAIFRYDPLTNTNLGTAWTLSGYSSPDFLTQGSLSDDGRYLLVYGIAGGQKRVICFDLIAGIHSALNVTTRPHSGSVSHSGDYIHLNWDASGTAAEQGVWLYDRDFTVVRQMSPKKEHSDFAVDACGNEVWVLQPDGSNPPLGPSMWMHRLDNGDVTEIIVGTSAFRHGHVSGRNSRRPGWAYLSVYDNATGTNPGTDQLAAVRLDGSGIVVEVFGHSHAHAASNLVGDADATVNRDGTKFLFRSEWGGTDSFEFVATA